MSTILPPPVRQSRALRSIASISKKKVLVFSVIAGLVALGYFAVKYVWNDLMIVVSPLEAGKSDTVRVYDRNDRLVCTISGNEDRVPVRINEVSTVMKEAVVAAEDHAFFEHHGVNLESIMRAAIVNAKAGGVREGGSTITQQLAKTLYSQGAERTIPQKLKETAIAWQLENRYSKDKILESYLNQVYFGRGAYGIERAAERYFGKHAAKLDLAESAYLTALINAPSTLSLPGNRKDASKRQAMILDQMVECKFIEKAEAEKAKTAKLNVRAAAPLDSYYLYYVDAVMADLQNRLGSEKRLDGLSVYTNMDLAAQKAAISSINSGVLHAPRGVTQAALVSISVQDGAVIALVGGAGNYWKHQYNRATNPHTVGSAFKPFVYLAAILSGVINPHTILYDEPIEVTSEYTKPYSPRNFDHEFLGAMTVREALSRSRNVCAVKVGVDTGIDNVINTARLAGIKTKLEPNVSLTLGACAVTPMEMAAAYGTLARGGVSVEPTLIRRVNDFSGNLLYQNKAVHTRVFDEEPDAQLVDLLQDVVQYGTGRSAQLPGRPVAGKTGTADQAKDLWFVGFTPDLVTATWGGNDENRAIPGSRVSGGSVMAGIWRDYMQAYYKSHPTPAGEFAAPMVAMDRQTYIPFNSLASRIEEHADQFEEEVTRGYDVFEEKMHRKKRSIFGAVGHFFKRVFD